ncbi:serine hydrolase [Umezawaea endophytica]|uniref:Class A beta-lactamase-related serine hydrolase n=1 Tax=Umezawaea endophytica TaxID=1654476 RepID=A0A9X3AE64_9PSEU|nr:class A beta-lactamase-related serine hydrolase [Umezawaea endophytica]MCS7476476.1 class A beta-lactamase-related serine hydrolase [Umezawaea endophytica]
MNRRQVLTATGVVGASMLIGTGQAAAEPKGWLGWIAGNRDHVGVVLDDGRGGRLSHRPHQEQVLASAIKAVHAAGYALAVEQGRARPDEQVRVGDWEAYYLGLDGGAHQRALTDLAIPFSNGVTADDPDRLVPLDDLVKVALVHSDNAASDFVRTRVGDATLRAAALRCGWPGADTRSIAGEMLLLILPERAPANPAHRKRVGDALAAQALRDPQLQLEIIGRLPHIPSTYDGQRPWTRQTWRGSAAHLHRLHRSIAGGKFPAARVHLERAFAGSLPPGVKAIGFKGGALPGVLTLAFTVRWEDGRIGTGVLLTEEVPLELFSREGELVDLTLNALLDPAALRELRDSVVG